MRVSGYGWCKSIGRSPRFLVPTMLQRILDHPDFDGTDPELHGRDRVRRCRPRPVELVSRAMSAMPNVAFANVFGQTETLGAYTTLSPEDHHDPNRAGSVGRPLPGWSTFGWSTPRREPTSSRVRLGELWVNTCLHVGEGLLHTGDLARRDSDGYIYPSGRLKDIINRGGEKFGPGRGRGGATVAPGGERRLRWLGVADGEMGQRVGCRGWWSASR